MATQSRLTPYTKCGGCYEQHYHVHGIVQPILDAIGSWVKEFRQAIGVRGELANFREEEVAFIAKDMGMTPQELLFAVSKGPHAADELPKLLSALGVIRKSLRSKTPAKCEICNASASLAATKISATTILPPEQPLATTGISVRTRCPLMHYFTRNEKP